MESVGGVRLDAKMLKSDAAAVVAPEAPETDIVQTIVTPARTGLMLTHDNEDALVGFP